MEWERFFAALRMTECDTCYGHLDTAASALLQPPLDDRTWAACAGRAEPLDGGARPVIEPVEMPARCFEMYR